MLGAQIAVQAAAYGYEVRRYDPDPSMFGQMQAKVRTAMPMARTSTEPPSATRSRACRSGAEKSATARKPGSLLVFRPVIL
jgi:3-hydroxyacyl-CoA dehydrogenase